MKAVLMNFRMEAEKKKKMEEICDKMGITMTAAFNLFASKVIEEGCIPFEITASTKKQEEREKEMFQRFLAYYEKLKCIEHREAEKDGNTNV